MFILMNCWYFSHLIVSIYGYALSTSLSKEGGERFYGVHMTKIPLQAQSLHEVCTLFPLLTLDGLSVPLWTKHPFSLESFD